LLADADVFVLPSHQEGFSMAITEALAAGCPPVVTEECNFDELEPRGIGVPADDRGIVRPADASAGIIIRNGDMTAFTDAVTALLADPARHERLAAAGRQLVASRFTWQIIAEQMEQNYRHILAGGKFLPDGNRA
jgi:glycosyltransferase involved in cell wall biosynthesis